MLAVNELLQGRYRIIRQLGHGGMGAVYEAQDERLGSSVALKEIAIEIERFPTETQREVFRRAFEREAKILASLHHEVFPRVMDYFSEFDRQFLIMELVYGDDLSQLLGRYRSPFALEETARWLDDLLDALDYLHTHTPPIYHRDIKPQNLKLTTRGRIKLLDFGIAKSVDQSGSTITSETFVGATLDYAPIEQVLPATPRAFLEFIILKHKDRATAILEQSTDARCDIYAVGATFYHLLTNRAPVDSARRSLELWEGNPDPLPNPLDLNPALLPAVSAWLLKALQIEREDRFSSAVEMQTTLHTAIREAEAKKYTAKRTLVLPTEELYLAEEQLTIAETGILVEAGPTQIEIGGKEDSLTQPSPAETLESHSTNVEPRFFASLPSESKETKPAGGLSAPELTATSYFDEKLLSEKNTFPEITRTLGESLGHKTESSKVFIRNRIIILAGTLLFAGIGATVWLGLGSSISPGSNKLVSNVVVSTPMATDTPDPKIGSMIRNGIWMEFMFIPAGSFQMGDKDNGPIHRVTISRDFWMGWTEVTQAEWKAVMGSLPTKCDWGSLGGQFLGDSKPVICVSWEDIQGFIKRLNARGEGTYRLPTEAEWEYAARAGTTGDYYGDLDAIGWYKDNSDNMTHEVGLKQPNAWGLYDMTGNVMEWVEDRDGYYPDGAKRDPTGPSVGSNRLVRGGSWYSDAAECRSATRFNDSPGARDADLGFRLVRNPG